MTHVASSPRQFLLVVPVQMAKEAYIRLVFRLHALLRIAEQKVAFN